MYNLSTFYFDIILLYIFPFKYYRSKSSRIYCTWSVQKVSRILNFRGLRIFPIFDFLWRCVGTHTPHLCRQIRHFECSVNFWQLGRVLARLQFLPIQFREQEKAIGSQIWWIRWLRQLTYTDKWGYEYQHNATIKSNIRNPQKFKIRGTFWTDHV